MPSIQFQHRRTSFKIMVFLILVLFEDNYASQKEGLAPDVPRDTPLLLRIHGLRGISLASVCPFVHLSVKLSLSANIFVVSRILQDNWVDFFKTWSKCSLHNVCQLVQVLKKILQICLKTDRQLDRQTVRRTNGWMDRRMLERSTSVKLLWSTPRRA